MNNRGKASGLLLITLLLAAVIVAFLFASQFRSPANTTD